jgi:hypothetical protein
MTRRRETTPWESLLDLEHERATRRPPTPRKRGRRPAVFSRTPVAVALTADEAKIDTALRRRLTSRFGRKVSRGQLYGFLLLRLRDDLLPPGPHQLSLDNGLTLQSGLDLPEDVTSFVALSAHLDQRQRRGRRRRERDEERKP